MSQVLPYTHIQIYKDLTAHQQQFADWQNYHLSQQISLHQGLRLEQIHSQYPQWRPTQKLPSTVISLDQHPFDQYIMAEYRLYPETLISHTQQSLRQLQRNPLVAHKPFLMH